MMKKIVTILALSLFSLSLWAQKAVHVGDVLCTDNTIVSIVDFAASGKKAMGVVFHVDDSGVHGLAVRLVQPMTTYWNKSMVEIDGLTFASSADNAILDMRGAQNTKAIIKNNLTPDTLYAAYVASVIANREDGVEGWFLPSYGQMELMYHVLMDVDRTLDILKSAGVKVNAIASGRYWTSTGCTTEKAMARSMGYNSVAWSHLDPVEKTSFLNLRSVREF